MFFNIILFYSLDLLKYPTHWRPYLVELGEERQPVIFINHPNKQVTIPAAGSMYCWEAKHFRRLPLRSVCLFNLFFKTKPHRFRSHVFQFSSHFFHLYTRYDISMHYFASILTVSDKKAKHGNMLIILLIQPRSYLGYGTTDSLVTVSTDCSLGSHAWLPYDKAVPNYFYLEKDATINTKVFNAL